MTGDPRARCIDALQRLDMSCQDDRGNPWTPEALAVRHAVEALDAVMRNWPSAAVFLEGRIAAMCEAVDVEGP